MAKYKLTYNQAYEIYKAFSYNLLLEEARNEYAQNPELGKYPEDICHLIAAYLSGELYDDRYSKQTNIEDTVSYITENYEEFRKHYPLKEKEYLVEGCPYPVSSVEDEPDGKTHTYDVMVEEMWVHYEKVRAKSAEEAQEKVQEMYDSGEFIMDSYENTDEHIVVIAKT